MTPVRHLVGTAPPMLRGEVSPEAKAKAERAASAAGISLAWLLDLLILKGAALLQ